MFLRNLIQASAILPFLYNTASAQIACNNSPSLCNKPYNNVTYLGAHDSPFLRDESTGFSTSGNQYYDTTTQLDAGVRLLSAQVHKLNNTEGNEAWHLCHSSCNLLDAGTLGDWLSEIKTWMDTNQNDVVTILLVNGDDAMPAELGQHFQQSGIAEYAYTPPSTDILPQQWPTLQSLISNGTRLMTFVASLQPSPDFPYLMDEFSFMFENDFENDAPTDYSCTPDRPGDLTSETAASSGRMFLMNHFLYSTQLFGIQSPNDTYVNVTNAQTGLGALGTQIQECTGVYSKPPNFVLVDFFNVGPAMSSVDAANGVDTPSGRRSIPNAAKLEEFTGGVVKRQGSILAVVIAVVVSVCFGL
ncbi:PLC-like phosphodiesterase [Massariosphaeria phaeospora]|uniref:PLC-like phosphodiesterase n=1 Tax=Massariosphaeria phaeospora TaxID=100035 RepID=A0A7C8M3R4_9PLEO|nr:PLC-like phosphodiesterase [Massariosphaeria phaeospora]